METTHLIHKNQSFMTELPQELIVNILDRLPIASLFSTKLVNRSFQNSINYLLSKLDKLELVEALLSEKFYKTAFVTLARFELNQEPIRKQIIEKFKTKKSLHNFIVIGLLTKENSKPDISLQGDLEFKDPTSFVQLKNLDGIYLKRLKSFLLCFDRPEIKSKEAAFLYYIYKNLYTNGLDEKIAIGKNTFLALANLDQLEIFLDFLEQISKKNVLVAPVMDRSPEEEIFKLAKSNTLIAFFELISNLCLTNYGQFSGFYSTLDHRVSNNAFVYEIFKKSSNDFEGIEQYLNLAKQQKRILQNLIDATTSIRKISFEKNAMESAFLATKWILILLNSTKQRPHAYFCKFIDDYTFLEWSHLIDFIPEQIKESEIEILIEICLKKETTNHFIDALYCMRLLSPDNCLKFQKMALECLKKHHHKWQLLKSFIPLKLQDNLGDLITYTLSQNFLGHLSYFDCIGQAQMILCYFDPSDANSKLRKSYEDLIANVINQKQAEILSFAQMELDCKWIDMADENENEFEFFGRNDMDIEEFYSD